jgi:maleylpyruvate isomerase
VDLSAGTTVADLPAQVIDTMLDDVTGMLTGRPGCPSVLLDPVDRDRTWHLGPDIEDPVVVQATAARLLAWATGRADETELTTVRGPATATALTLPRWL